MHGTAVGRWSVLAGVAVLVAASSAPQLGRGVAEAAPAACTRYGMALPAGTTHSSVSDSDPTGRFQIGEAHAGKAYAVLWDGGKPQTLGTLDTVGTPTAVNSRGDVAGSKDDVSGEFSRAWVRRAGSATFQELPFLDEFHAHHLEAVDPHGVIVGTVWFRGAAPTDDEGHLAALWSYGHVQRLALPSGFHASYVADLDDRGIVVGTVYKYVNGDPNLGAIEQLGIVWYPDGTWKLLRGTSPTAFVMLTAVRAGIVVGVQGAPSKTTVLRWNIHTGAPTVLASGSRAFVNVKGSVALRDNGGKSFLLQKGILRPLLGPAGTHSTHVSAVADNDVAYGTATFLSPFRERALRWDCR